MRVQGLRRLNRKLAAMPVEARKAIGEAIDKGANEIIALQKSAAPVDDGALQASIRKRRGGRGIAGDLKGEAGLSVTITAGGAATTRPVREGASATYDYALAQEFGTQKMPANPFFFPAYRLLKKRVKGRITRATTKAARAAVGK